MGFLLHTDLGHDPDDAIALSYLIENKNIPSIIGLSPGHIQQKEVLSGLINAYELWDRKIMSYGSVNPPFTPGFSVGKHKVFCDNTLLIENDLKNTVIENGIYTSLIIGPAKGLADLECEELFFQGGYSPNSIKPLEKFTGKQAVPSFNPNGTGKDFIKIVNSNKIKRKFFVGKNVCHGFTKKDLSKIWQPKNPTVLKFWNQLKESKAMHDVLAAILFINKDLGIWEQAKPIKTKEGYSTEPTTEKIYSLIGVKL